MLFDLPLDSKNDTIFRFPENIFFIQTGIHGCLLLNSENPKRNL
ncbi:hypothetical protein BLGI_908 [Brevibacillus laterosporus GI-9]|nr:hypothetical protein BLGI_908 [Brevibacillus laterosporus GI-9]